MSLTESEVQNVVDELVALKLVSNEGAFSGRVEKYKHRFCNTEFGSFKLTERQLAVVCVMLLRGPQTPGELRTRTNRLAEFANVNEVEAVLTELQELNGDIVVVKLEREPGKRESRYGHLFSGERYRVTQSTADVSSEVRHDPDDRIASLEAQVQALTEQLQTLTQRIDELGL